MNGITAKQYYLIKKNSYKIFYEKEVKNMSKKLKILEEIIEKIENSIFKEYLLNLREEEFGINKGRNFLSNKYEEIEEFYKIHEKDEVYENKNS
jgi:hypothetical protein